MSPTVAETRELCPDFSPRQQDSGAYTCRFLSDSRCLVQGREVCHLKGRDAPPATRPLDRFSYSRVSTWQSCPYKFKLRYIDGLKPDVEPVWAREGKAYHSGMESLYRSEGERIVIESTGDETTDQVIGAVLDGLNNAEMLYTPGQYEIEQELQFEMDGITWLGYMDRFDIAHGTIVDYKTARDPSTVTLLANIYQLSVYRAGCHITGREVEAAQLDIIRKPALRKGKSENEASFIARVLADVYKRPAHYYTIRRYEASEINWTKYMGELNKDAQRILQDIETGHFPRRPRSCGISGCEYAGVCVEGL